MISGRFRTVAATLLLLGVLAILFLSLDFRAVHSASGTHLEISKYTIGLAQGEKAQPPESLDLHVEGKDPLALALRAELSEPMVAALGLTGVRLLDVLPEQAGGPVLMVRVADQGVNWTPIYARAAVTARMVYASDGDLSWRDEFTVRMSTTDGEPQIRVRGDIRMEDTTTGVVSQPAYRRLLAGQIAAAVSEALKKQLSG